MEAIYYLLDLIFNVYLMLLILRVWLQAVRADFYNPFSQFIVKATNPVVIVFRRFVPGFKGVDMATIIVAYIISCAKLFIFVILGFYAMEPIAIFLIGFMGLVKQVGSLALTIMIVMALMSWVVQSASPIQMIFHQLTQPILAPIRKILPDLGGLDLSVAVACIGLIFLDKLIAGFIPFWSFI